MMHVAQCNSIIILEVGATPMLAPPEKCMRLARGPGRGDGSKHMASKVQYIQTDLNEFRCEKCHGSDGMVRCAACNEIDILTATYPSSSS